MRSASILFLTVFAVSGIYTSPAFSDEITLSDFPEETSGTMPMPAADAKMTGVPRHLLTMEQVESQFGAPAEKMPAVGEPPITRWVYKEYTVYFEHQLVLHTVINR